MITFLAFFSILFIVITLLPFIKTGKWWIRIFDYPRLQIAFFILISLVLNFLYLDLDVKGIVLNVLLIFSLLYHLSLIVKYTPLYKIQAANVVCENKSNTIKIIEVNVRMKNRNSHLLINLVKKHLPDVLIVTEPDIWWKNELEELKQEYPNILERPLDNTYGLLLYSRFPIKNTEINFLVTDDIPSFFTAVVLPSGLEIDLHCLHPKPPMPGIETYERDTEILLIGKRVKKSGKPSIVVGDLNDVAWSYTSSLFQRYSGLLDPRQGRGLFNTYNVFIPLLRYPLDHFFYSHHFGLIKLERLDSVGSDHYPMMVEICYEGDKNHALDKTKADISDKIEVEEKIQEGKEKAS
ncbi:MAG: endonuclease/exonuclease/phosphatase family protein [Opitutaceae bacterium]|nr:endonuclease/exonuclease/phosphatase family protein [Cytophagales bacterium]